MSTYTRTVLTDFKCVPQSVLESGYRKAESIDRVIWAPAAYSEGHELNLGRKTGYINCGFPAFPLTLQHLKLDHILPHFSKTLRSNRSTILRYIT